LAVEEGATRLRLEKEKRMRKRKKNVSLRFKRNINAGQRGVGIGSDLIALEEPVSERGFTLRAKGERISADPPWMKEKKGGKSLPQPSKSGR